MKEINNRILVLGASGMLGHVVYDVLRKSKRYDVKGTKNSLTGFNYLVDFNVKNLDSLDALFHTYKPAVVINCIGVLINDANRNIENAVFINSYFPHYVANLATTFGAKLIHVSTDCVFSGKSGKYSETDFSDAIDIYGRSKSLGEVNYGSHLTLRTSIIGPELKNTGSGLLNWFLNSGNSIYGYTDHFWGGVTTLQLAKVILQVLENDYTGLVHVSNGLEISKYELLNIFKEVWCKENLSIEPCEVGFNNKSLLSSDKYQFVVPGYREMIKDLYAWMKEYPSLYRHY
ncbi:MAG: SDR family oxidoreductase [Bacteroidia bacterium]|nr:SDR family oxidoreductase [Bacteroidia bacterium]